MKKFLSIAALTVAAAGIAYATYTMVKKKNSDENIDDLVYTEDFNDAVDLEDDAYFEVEIDKDEAEDVDADGEVEIEFNLKED